MKILIVCGEYYNQSNGLSLSTQRFVEQFKKLGEEVKVLSSNHGGESEYSVPIIRLPLVDGIMEKQNYHFAKPVKETIEEALNWADLVHIEDPFPMSAKVASMAKEKGLPITATFHLYPENMTYSVPIFNFKLSNNNIMRVFKKAVYKYCYAIQCPTEKVRERLQDRRYISKLFVISNGIPESYIAKDVIKKNNELFTIVSVGRYSREKDQKTLIKAIKMSKYKDQIKLILAGKGPLEKKYQKLVKDLPNEPVLKFYKQDELKDIIRNADLYVHCANVEIEGMGCMEAFAQGTVPIIADSRLSSTSTYALSKMNKYRSGRSKELANKIDYWYEHQDELYEYSQKYIDLAHTLTTEKSAVKVLKMMKEAYRAYQDK